MQPIVKRIHVAIDFGGDGCALAFGYNNKVSVYKQHKHTNFIKVKTQILLNARDRVEAFGDTAKNSYLNLRDEKAKRTFKYIDNFKMSLQGCDIRDEKEEIYLESIDDKKCPADIVFDYVFKQLKRIAMDYIKNNVNEENITTQNQEIEWIITVPITWSNNTNNKIKEWAIGAGLTNNCIVNEMDCIALNILKQSQEKKQNEAVKVNDTYTIVNIRKTIDIACYKVIDSDNVKQITNPISHPLNGYLMNDLYIKLLGDIFDKEWIHEFKQLSPNIYFELMDHFENASSTFYKQKNKNKNNKHHNIELTFQFYQYLRKKCGENGSTSTIQDILNEYTNNELGATNNTIDENGLKLDIKIWKNMYGIFINQIKKEIASANKKSNIYLISDLATINKKYFHNEIKEKLKDHSLIIPKQQTWCVAKGAAYVGMREALEIAADTTDTAPKNKITNDTANEISNDKVANNEGKDTSVNYMQLGLVACIVIVINIVCLVAFTQMMDSPISDRKRVASLTTTIEQLRIHGDATNTGLKKLLMESDEKIVNLQAEIVRLENGLNKKKNVLDIDGEIAELKADLKTKNDNLNQAIKESNGAISSLATELETQNNGLIKEIKDSNGKIATLTTDLTTKHNTLNEAIQTSDTKIDDLQKDLDAKNTHLTGSISTLQGDLNTKNTNLKSEIEQSNTKIAGLQLDLETKNTNLNGQIVSLNKKLDEKIVELKAELKTKNENCHEAIAESGDTLYNKIISGLKSVTILFGDGEQKEKNN